MRTGSFAGLNLSLRALYSSTKAMDITSQNIANVGTEGYTRRVAQFKTFGQDATGITEPIFGLGADCVSAERMRDEYLDTKMWNQSSISGEWSTKNEYYLELEKIINESSVSGLVGAIDEFSAAMNDFANNPSSTTYRYLVQNKGVQLTDYFNETSAQLEELQTELNDKVKEQVDAINDIAKQIADLNSKIRNNEITGRETNLLRDERDLLIDSLAEYGDIEVTEKSCGELINGSEDLRLTIKFAGTVMIDHDSYRELEISKRIDKKNQEDVEGLYDVGWKDGATLKLSSGSLKAVMDLRDGNGSDDTGWVKGVPHYMDELNKIARNFAMAFNEGIVNGEKVSKGHAEGYTFNSAEDATEPAGLRFFCTDERYSNEFANGWQTNADIISGYQELNAGNISLSKEVLDDVGNMFKSFDSPLNNNDTESIQSLLDFKENSKLFGTSNLEDYVSGMITNLGVDADVSEKLYNSHTSIMTQLENQRDAYSGVSLDEEATNLVKYQQMYKAAAKVMSTFAEIYEVLVNTI